MNLEKILSYMYEDSCGLHNQGRDSEAIFSAEQTAVQALNTLGLAYCGYLKNYEKSLECFRHALKIDPGNWLLWSNITHVYSCQEKHEESLDACLKSMTYVQGKIYDPYYNAGVVLTALNRSKEAEGMYQIARQLNPNDPNIDYNLGLVMLRQRLCQEGWDLYENRFKTSELTRKFRERFLQPHWDGRKFKNKSLLIYSEQGLGDFVFYSRFIPMVKSLGGKVICEVQKPIAPLISKDLGVDEVIVRENNTSWPKPADSDYCASVCSLPRILKIDDFKKVPKDPYLSPIKKSKPRNFSSKKLKIGLCWCGNPDHQRDHTRSIPLEKFRPLANHPNIQLFGLVKAVNPVRNWPTGWVNLNEGIENFPITNLADKIDDFGDLSNYMSHLDLIITVDTGLAHLAGALGVPVWNILGREIDFRWGDDQETSEWYPSMRLFRFKNSWEETIQKIVDELPKE